MTYPSQILIVDDEAILAENLKNFLDQKSADVRIALDAEEAMVTLVSFSPDLLILDYALPRIDGLSAYEMIVRVSSKVPICILITGNPIEAIAERARLLGVSRILSKPFSLAELQLAIHASMNETDDSVVTDERRIEERRSHRVLRFLADGKGMPGRRERKDDNLPESSLDPIKA